MLAQRSAVACKWAAVPRSLHKPARQARKTIVARDNVDVKVVEDGDLSPALAAGFFIASKQGAFAATMQNMRTVMAGCILAVFVINALTRSMHGNDDLNRLAPAALAAEAANVLTIGPAAIASFGTVLCTAAEAVVGIKQSFYAFVLTLAAAVYYEMGAIWIAAALAVVFGNKFVRAAQDNKILAGPALLCGTAIFALVKYAKDNCLACAGELCVAVVSARCLWSLFTVLRSLANELTD